MMLARVWSPDARMATRSELAALTPEVNARIDEYRRAADRAGMRAARQGVVDVLARLTGVAPAAVRIDQWCPRCGASSHGQPRIRGHPFISVSWSHSDKVVAAAVSTVSRVAIDVEQLRATDRTVQPVGLTQREYEWVVAQPDTHRAHLRLWTRKEGLVKLGRLTLDDLQQCELVGDDGVSDWWHGIRFVDIRTSLDAIATVSLAPTERPRGASVGTSDRYE